MRTIFFTAIAFSSLGAFAAQAQTADDTTAKPQETAITAMAEEAEFGAGGYTTTDGEQIYNTLCAGCHMTDGGGAAGAGAYPALRSNEKLEFASYSVYIIVNGQGGMPSLATLLDDEQVVAVTAYIQSHLGNGYKPDATMEMVADSRPADQEAELAEHDVIISEESGQGVIRHPIPESDFPILQAVEVSADATLVYLSGTVPLVIDDTAAEGAPEQYGDTAAQTASTLASIEQKLADLDLDMGDVIKMQAYLVVPKGEDQMDFAGFMEGYSQYFGTVEQPNLPTRSVFAVAGLANPSWLVEIEVVAVRP